MAHAINIPAGKEWSYPNDIRNNEHRGARILVGIPSIPKLEGEKTIDEIVLSGGKGWHG